MMWLISGVCAQVTQDRIAQGSSSDSKRSSAAGVGMTAAEQRLFAVKAQTTHSVPRKETQTAGYGWRWIANSTFWQAALRVEFPTMESALNRVSDNPPFGQIGAKVRAVGAHDLDDAVCLGRRPLGRRETIGLDLPGRHFTGQADRKP